MVHLMVHLMVYLRDWRFGEEAGRTPVGNHFAFVRSSESIRPSTPWPSSTAMPRHPHGSKQCLVSQAQHSVCLHIRTVLYGGMYVHARCMPSEAHNPLLEHCMRTHGAPYTLGTVMCTYMHFLASKPCRPDQARYGSMYEHCTPQPSCDGDGDGDGDSYKHSPSIAAPGSDQTAKPHCSRTVGPPTIPDQPARYSRQLSGAPEGP